MAAAAAWGGEADVRSLRDVVAAAVDAGAGVHGDVYVAAGHHRGERGAAVDSAGSAGEPAGSAVGDRCLRAGAGGGAATGGPDTSTHGAAPGVSGRAWRVPPRGAGGTPAPHRAGGGTWSPRG